jgi:large subunit ribosomal protein L31
MKNGIHPTYQDITVTCACGNTFVAGSTHDGNIRVEICAHCHPLYTGKSKFIDTAGRMERFQQRLHKTQAAQEAAKARASKQQAKTPAPAEA